MIDHTTKAEMRDALVQFALGLGGIGIFGILVFVSFLK